MLFEKTGISVKGWPLVIGVFALVTVQMAVLTSGSEEKQREEEAAQAKASAERVAKVRAENLAYFEKNKAQVLQDVTTKVEAGQVNEALALITKYAAVSNDADLARAKQIVESAQAKVELQNEDNLPLARKAALYRKLAELEPDNREYAAKAQRFGGEYDRQLARERESREREAAAARRKELIERQFSGWDGSHDNVERAVKQSMNNPKSYEHVETRYLDKGSKIIVTTRFRGTNAFGGVVTNTVVAEVDEQGNVLSLRNTR